MCKSKTRLGIKYSKLKVQAIFGNVNTNCAKNHAKKTGDITEKDEEKSLMNTSNIDKRPL